ncbi:Respiratory supercomplex factor 1, mitochondrial [Microbotryomycetes sp. JL201]|nr:Respiratory supercomplex factor 1, mitochondrial [Microbotryomycetes sp. JL201]
MVGTYTPDPTPSEDWESAPIVPVVKRESTWDKFSRKFKDEPLVPIGIVATVAALLGATRSLQQGNRTEFNKFLRYRVAAQGLTVMAALGGSVYYQAERRQKKAREEAARREMAVTAESASGDAGPRQV